MFLFRQRRHKVVVSARNSLRDAIPKLMRQLEIAIEKLESHEAKYSRQDLARVLKAATEAHLSLKLGKLRLQNFAIMKYLNPVDSSASNFSACCLRVLERMETADPAMLLVHQTELKGIFIYLLSRLESLN